MESVTGQRLSFYLSVFFQATSSTNYSLIYYIGTVCSNLFGKGHCNFNLAHLHYTRTVIYSLAAKNLCTF
jgi:hypothetical protein